MQASTHSSGECILWYTTNAYVYAEYDLLYTHMEW
jgi:hypothetical protein